MRSNGKGRWARNLILPVITACLFFTVTATVPAWWCKREGWRWYGGDEELQSRLSWGVEEWIASDAGLDRSAFTTGSSQFNGEWLFGVYQMAGMGFGQTAVEHRAWRTRNLELMDLCIERLLTPEVRAFDAETWGADPLDSIGGAEVGHAAYLGYLNVLLSLRRYIEPQMPHAELNDRITEHLARGIDQSPVGLLRTYPIETYPMDNSTVVASIALYDRAMETDHSATIRRWIEEFRRHCIDPKTGLVYQSVVYQDGSRVDDPRGSGTAFSAYYLNFVDEKLSRDLYEAVKRELLGRTLGFGMVREYPHTVAAKLGDIDSGPVVGGYAVSPTGFLVGSSRLHHDPAVYTTLYATVHAFGAPTEFGGRRHYVTGGPIGDAIMFAMLTAQPSLKGVAQ